MTTGSNWPPFEPPAPEDHLIALGAFSLLYNEAEMALWVFFKRYIPSDKARDMLFFSLHNRSRVDLITALSEQEGEDFFCALKYGLQCFDTCTENRNIALHAFPDEGGDDETLAIMKRSQQKPGDLARYIPPLAQIRASAVACRELKDYFFGLYNWLAKRDAAIKESPIAPVGVPPLPRRPEKPRTLSSFRPGAVPKAD